MEGAAGAAPMSMLEGVGAVTDIAVDLIVIAGGILGFNYVKKMKEKQKESTFSYLTRLSVRLRYFREILITYRADVMNRFVPEDCRRETSADRMFLVDNVIKNLSQNARETLAFLKNQDDQMPAQKGWVNHFNLFVEFLIDCEQLDQDMYFKWTRKDDLEEKKNQYYVNALKNINDLLEMVDGCQKKVEYDMFFKD